MLVQKTMQENDVIALRLASGEEVIGKLKKLTADKLEISKPFILVASPQGLALVPFMISMPDGSDVTLERRHVLTEIVARKEIRDAYIQQTSNLITANAVPEGLIGNS